MDENNQLDPAEKTAGETPQAYQLSRDGRGFTISRRDFVKLAGFATSTAVLAACTPATPAATETPMPSDTPVPTDTLIPTQTATWTPTPTITSTPTPVPVLATIRSQGINLRTGPATTYYAIGALAKNVVVTVIGRLADGSWYHVVVALADLPKLQDAPIARTAASTGVDGWIRADLMDIQSGSPDTVLVETPPPTPTPMPNQAPSGEEGITYKSTDLYGNTRNYTLPCGSPIPEGAICSCNCVSLCSCVGYTAPSCSCDNDTSNCLCNLITYWYPN